MTFDHLEDAALDIIERYEFRKAAMLPLLWLVQTDQGHISRAAQTWVASLLDAASTTLTSIW